MQANIFKDNNLVTKKYSNVIVFVGNDIEYGSKVIQILIDKKIPITAICGESAKKILALIYKDRLKNVPVINLKRPWQAKKFFTLINAQTLGINGGLEVLVPDLVLDLLSIINCHPALLPDNRGSHHSFWTIMNETPAGATLHWMVKEIDAGPVIDQTQIKWNFETTAENLQKQCNKACLILIERNIKKIMQNRAYASYLKKGGSIHYKKDILKASTISEKQKISGRHLLKLIQATRHTNNGFYVQNRNQIFFIRAEVIKVDCIKS